MPTPSNAALASGLIVTAGLFFGGAYLASNLPISLDQLGELGPRAVATLVEPTQPSSMQETSRSSASALPQAVSAGGLEITIQGVEDNSGKLLLFVFADEASFYAFDYMNAVGFAELDATGTTVTYSFPDLTSGPYVVSLFHDINGNQDFDMRNGIPLEGYGTSRIEDPYATPTFGEAAVDAGAVTVQMHYLR